jgi:hypothetical protein
MTYVSWSLDIHCIYTLNAEEFLLTQYIRLDLQKRKFDLSEIIDFQ